MSGYFGTELQQRLQRRADELCATIAGTPGLCSAGRMVSTDDVDHVGLELCAEMLEKDGGFGFRLVPAERTAAISAFLAASSSAPACNIPVFRYALDHWAADTYRITLFHRGPLDDKAREVVRRVEARIDLDFPTAALEVVDLDTAPRPARGAVLPDARSSATYTHSRPVAVLPRPGSSTGTGVSSAWILSALRTSSRMRLTMGSRSAAACPVQPASVERSISSPCATIISAWRYSGRWWSNLDTTTCASVAKVALPRAMALTGAGA